MTDDPRTAIVDMLAPVLTWLAEELVDPSPGILSSESSAHALAGRLNTRWPLASPLVQQLATALRRDVADGHLCDRGEPSARFCRIAKPRPETHDFSIDLVSLTGPGAEHIHPQGEITLALPATDHDHAARFDGHAPGWIALPAGSRHVPTVTGGRMLLLYALPGGAPGQPQWI
jgi:2-hydroxylaminobenzoate mutase